MNICKPTHIHRLPFMLCFKNEKGGELLCPDTAASFDVVSYSSAMVQEKL